MANCVLSVLNKENDDDDDDDKVLTCVTYGKNDVSAPFGIRSPYRAVNSIPKRTFR